MTLYFCIAGVVLPAIYFVRSYFDRAWNIRRAVVRAAWGQAHGLAMDDPLDRNAGVFSNYRDSVPQFRPQTWRDALTTMLGDRDIRVGFEEIDKAFHISCLNETFMRSFVDSWTAQHLRDMTRWRIVCVGHTLTIISKALCSDDEYEAMLNAAITLERRIKQITS